MRAFGRLGRLALAAAVIGLAVAGDAGAQDGAPRGRAGERARGARGARVEQMLRRQLALSDSQVSQLRAATRSYAPRRFALARQENALADSLRTLLAAPARNEATVAALLDRLFAARRSRFALREREQRERAAFLTPSQRAMLLGFEEQAQRRAAAVRGERRGARPRR